MIATELFATSAFELIGSLRAAPLSPQPHPFGRSCVHPLEGPGSDRPGSFIFQASQPTVSIGIGPAGDHPAAESWPGGHRPADASPTRFSPATTPAYLTSGMWRADSFRPKR